MKPMSLQRSWLVLGVLLIACSRQTPPLQTELPNPTPIIASPTHVPTSTFISVTVIPSPLPREPVFLVITPDPIQVKRWNEYENALAQAFFKSSLQPEDVVCEWEILGGTNQEVYVYANCSGVYSAHPSAGSIPAVIHLGTDGSVESAEIPGAGTHYASDIRRMFPPEAQERIFNHSISFQEMDDRLRWRRGHPDEPPLLILNSLSTQPTPAIIPWITPDPIQVQRWKEYQTALAEQLSYLPPEEMLCEWEFLGRSGNEVYVWAICGEIRGGTVGLEGLLRIDVRDDGSVQSAVPSGIGGIGFPSEIREMFPPEVQERYFHGQIHFQELVDHLRWRQKLDHREDPPLIVLQVTPNP